MTTPELAPWLQRYFTEYLSAQRNVSHATITAYRDTFRLLLKHLRKNHRHCSPTLSLEILTSDTILRFLDDLEQQRGNSIRTRNARLAAIRSFVH
jgi:integrase/recombinase XerD